MNSHDDRHSTPELIAIEGKLMFAYEKMYRYENERKLASQNYGRWHGTVKRLERLRAKLLRGAMHDNIEIKRAIHL